MSEKLPHYSPEIDPTQAELEPQQMGEIVVITGASGAGKDTATQALLERTELGYQRIVTYAAREKRPGEIDGVDYHFISPEEFEQKEQADFFAETVQYGGGKGTPREPFKQVLHEGKKYIWRIDPSRAAEVEDFYRKKFPDHVEELMERTKVIYVGVPRLTVLKDRFKAREGELYSSQDFRERIQEDWTVWNKYKDKFPHVIMNDGTIDELIEQTLQIVCQ